MALSRRFAADKDGAVAIIFAFALLPMLLATGAAVDYSRASQARVALQTAVDGTILTLGKAAIESGQTDVALRARQAFDARFRRDKGTQVTTFEVSQSDAKLALNVGARVPVVFGGILGQSGMDVNARGEVLIGITSLEVALVLDNTGSMNEAGKMTELKRAARGLLDKLQAASSQNHKIHIAIVPFDTYVRPARSKSLPDWVRLTLDDLDKKNNGKNKKDKDDDDDDEDEWPRCITDRDQPYDTRGTLPNTALSATLYPAVECDSDLQRILPLTKDFSALRRTVERMKPAGATNTTIGLAWGLNVLTPGAPMSSDKTPDSYLKKHIVFLTDGENTQNRWTKDRVQIDARTTLICDEIKKANIALHTIRVVEGNEALLKNCASDPITMYHSVSKATDLGPVFEKIAAQLIALRLSR